MGNDHLDHLDHLEDIQTVHYRLRSYLIDVHVKGWARGA